MMVAVCRYHGMQVLGDSGDEADNDDIDMDWLDDQ
jgi:hypothetical protein